MLDAIEKITPLKVKNIVITTMSGIEASRLPNLLQLKYFRNKVWTMKVIIYKAPRMN